MTGQSQQVERMNRQVQHIESLLGPLRLRSNRLSWLRVAIFLVGTATCVALFWLVNLWLAVGTCFLAVALLLFVIHRHNQLEQAIARLATWQQIKRDHVARLRLDWPQMTPAGPVEPGADHPFAADLDLVGEFSLHRLLDRAVSVGGSQRLYSWLANPLPNQAEIAYRQQIVQELIPLSLWRDRLVLNARSWPQPIGAQQTQAQQAERSEMASLLRWFEQDMVQPSLLLWLRVSFALLGLSLLLGILALTGVIGPWWQGSFVAYLAVQFIAGQAGSETFSQALSLQASLARLLAVLRQIETFSYRNTPHLRQHCAVILDAAQRPSQILRRVSWIVAASGIQGNPVVALLCNAFFPWNLYFAHQLQRVKAETAQRLPAWLELWYELEAFNSLATFGWLHPGHCFPQVQSEAAPFCFQAQQLGHPLLANEAKVRNNFSTDQLGTLALITGSNMAGKSTFLRTLGLNLVLAFAGSVVDATALQTPALRLFTSIKISDSVTQGVSYFYAEVKRLKRLLEELEQKVEHNGDSTLPLFFCIDEIFRGTNNRERLIGSRAYIRQLVGKQGIGLISTHDLELVQLADELPQITNYHFRDEIVQGAMIFDYKLHRGPCPTTNALIVMRNAGLLLE